MRISIYVPGYIYDQMTEQPVEDWSVLATLDGWQYNKGSMYDYIDMELAEQGVVGGVVRARCTLERGLEIITDYWAPDDLRPSYIDQLSAETRSQLSDGIGEGGFEIALGGRTLVLMADTDVIPDIEQVYDGKPVPTPSRIPRAARIGSIPMLEDALASGEGVDSTIQGYSGLHLAILYGHTDIALLLISRGANPNLAVGDGDETPLHLCALSNSLDDSESGRVVKALLEHGADKWMTTTGGNTAMSLAEIRHKMVMLRVLREEMN